MPVSSSDDDDDDSAFAAACAAAVVEVSDLETAARTSGSSNSRRTRDGDDNEEPTLKPLAGHQISVGKMLAGILDKRWADVDFEGSGQDERKSPGQRRRKRQKPATFPLLRGVVIDESTAAKEKKESLSAARKRELQRLRHSTARQRILKGRRALCYDSDSDRDFTAKIAQVMVEPALFRCR